LLYRNRDTRPLLLVFTRQPEKLTARLTDVPSSSNPSSVLIDEAYVDFADDNCLDLARQPNVVVARTLSKSFSLAGLRLGYVVGPAALIAALYKIKDSYNVDRLAQEIALAAVGDWPHMRGWRPWVSRYSRRRRIFSGCSRRSGRLARFSRNCAAGGFWFGIFPVR
jgi:histidinol-phosphate/aromatic aminotransferase/cobyric acid decarboxylase-like protein